MPLDQEPRDDLHDDPRNLEVSALFHRLSDEYPELHQPSQSELIALDSDFRRARQKENTLVFMLGIFGSIVFYLSFPILLVYGYRTAWAIAPAVEVSFDQNEFVNSYPEFRFGFI